MIKQARICDKCGSLIEIIEPWNEPWTGEDVCKECRRGDKSYNAIWIRKGFKEDEENV